MDAAALREMQAPIKQKYKDDPSAALARLHAEGDFRDEGITATVETWSGPQRAGSTRPPAATAATPAPATCCCRPCSAARGDPAQRGHRHVAGHPQRQAHRPRHHGPRATPWACPATCRSA